MPAPAYGGVVDAAGIAFVRPHDLMLSRPGEGDGASAVIRHVTVLGAVVRVELSLDDHIIEAETSRQRHSELALVPGQHVLLWPRQARFFLRDGWEGTSLDGGDESARTSAML